MSKLWQNYQKEKKYILDKKPPSPYIEVWDSRPAVVKVNPLVRLANIFLPLCQKDSGLTAEEQDEIANKIFHYLASLDRLQGMDTTALHLLAIQKDLENGKYGTEIAAWYQTLNAVQQGRILQGIFQHTNQALPGNELYRLFIQAFFPGTQVYFYDTEQKVLVYLPYPKDAAREKRAAMLQQLFLDWALAIQLFWQYPFGIIGKSETMQLGAMVIY